MTTQQTTTTSTQALPTIKLGRQLREVAGDAIKALAEAEKHSPTLFLQSNRLVRVGKDKDKRPVIVPVGAAELKVALTQAADFVKVHRTVDGEQKTHAAPPKDVIEYIQGTQQNQLPFPSLEGIVEVPTLRTDGTILDKPGYDAKTKLYYFPSAGMDKCNVPEQPTQNDVEAALEVIWDAIGQFPYVSDANKANTLGAVLTPLVRPAIKNHIPLCIIDSPKPGTGKGLLIDFISAIATSEAAAVLIASTSDEEWSKKITGLLQQGNTLIVIDNIRNKLQSSALESVLTADYWKGRLLGANTITRLKNGATWLATGNNVKIGGDLQRRCYRVQLDAQVSRPWTRTGFNHKNLTAWAKEHRPEIVVALLTIARYWFDQGKQPAPNIPALGTFSEWAETVGGILNCAGVHGFLGNLDDMYSEADEEEAQWETFVTAWLDFFGSDWKLVADLVTEIKAAEENKSAFPVEALPDALQLALKEKPNSFNIALGRALEKRVRTPYGKNNLRLEKENNASTKQKKWRVYNPTTPTQPPPQAGGDNKQVVEKSDNTPSDKAASGLSNNRQVVAGSDLTQRGCTHEKSGNGLNNYPQPPAYDTSDKATSGLSSDLEEQQLPATTVETRPQAGLSLPKCGKEKEWVSAAMLAEEFSNIEGE